ncbi:LysR family transcriptional regulator [Pelagibacterium sp.]|uniref:LysR family transcriptional regulator n=1 Tax=Pelagibacterium sp. TaxID=1967288 RepID=UPI003A8E56A4
MTLEQLAIFVAVAEREHITRAAEAINMTPSAVSSAIKALETSHGIRLFERVGRGIELSGVGQAFLPEARRTLSAARQAAGLLDDLGGLRAGHISIHASQTIANYWLPPRMLGFAKRYSGISIAFEAGNTKSVAKAVLEGDAEIGFIEGSIDEPALDPTHVYSDELVAVVSKSTHTLPANPTALDAYRWIVREKGSGTRTEFEHGLGAIGLTVADFDVALTLPTNEAVLNAVLNSSSAAALSRLVVAPFLASGQLRLLDVTLPPRHFTMLHHKERRLSAAAKAFKQICVAPELASRAR